MEATVGAYRGSAANQIAADAQAALSPVAGLIDKTVKLLQSGDIFGGALSPPVRASSAG
jgi:hypothetical protein